MYLFVYYCLFIGHPILVRYMRFEFLLVLCIIQDKNADRYISILVVVIFDLGKVRISCGNISQLMFYNVMPN